MHISMIFAVNKHLSSYRLSYNSVSRLMSTCRHSDLPIPLTRNERRIVRHEERHQLRYIFRLPVSAEDVAELRPRHQWSSAGSSFDARRHSPSCSTCLAAARSASCGTRPSRGLCRYASARAGESKDTALTEWRLDGSGSVRVHRDAVLAIVHRSGLREAANRELCRTVRRVQCYTCEPIAASQYLFQSVRCDACLSCWQWMPRR